jgi:hypothetical protein
MKKLFAVAAVASVALLAGCASGRGTVPPSVTTSAPASGQPASAPSSPAAPAAPATQPAASTGSSVDAASRTPECQASQLRIAYTDNAQIRNGALAGMSKVDSVVTFTNVGGTTCLIQGYPGVAALDSAGRQIAQATRNSAAVHPVDLRPGSTASALVAANSASCQALTSVPGLLVTAPDQYTSTRLGPAGDLCLDSLTVSPVAPGDAAGLPV